ncbi:zinc finger-containing ubiquitin peptidase 1-like [Anneissia japonica]|uniref:zinc finger-containing ubiquitin peptidase 1-like n=1 Tax=Anneissia japonica TaxID=1529436 RepID=UPI0014259242|nr:zinc finger-containing ubiquitin peptidase 1-like [Anneissia japonica]
MSLKTPLFTCAICGQEKLDADRMNTHMLDVHVQAKCPMCDLEGVSADDLEYHINTAHADILSPANSGRSSRINGHTATKYKSPDAQSNSMHNGCEFNSQKNGDVNQSKGKTLLALSKEHALNTGAVSNDVRTKDATGRKIKNSRKKVKETREKSEKENSVQHLQYCVPDQETSSLEDDVATSSSSSSLFSVISMTDVENQDNSSNANGRSSLSRVQSPLKKKVKMSSDNDSDSSILSVFKNIILRSPCKGEDSGSVDAVGGMLIPPRNVYDIGTGKSTNEPKYRPPQDGATSSHELKYCPLCEYSSTDVNLLAHHVDAHFSADTNDDETLARELSQADDVSNTDEMIARQIEMDERMKVENEATQFQELQVKKYENKNNIVGSTNMPSISKIQQLIEKAWEEGYDEQGREQLGGKIYNTRKWIGATEVMAFFTSLKVRCKLIDFHHPSGPNNTHPLLFDWIQKYFESPPALGSLFSRKAICSNKLPLYLQHEGHSRTIIGYEQLKDKSIRLLLFDPSFSQKQIGLLKTSELTGYALKPLRQTLTNFKSKQYQIVAIQGNLTENESKV